MNPRPSYFQVALTFARNSLVRDMTFRSNFLIEAVTSMAWMLMNLGFYTLIYRYTTSIAGWNQYQFFLFLATGLFINSLVQTFFMTNFDELSDLIRTGSLDFALLKPIDTQFLISLRRVDWSSLANFVLGASWPAMRWSSFIMCRDRCRRCSIRCMYCAAWPFTIASCSCWRRPRVWMGRNLTLLDFWFYVTTFSRYPMEIYNGRLGTPLRLAFTFVIPVLVVVNVPARLLVRPLAPQSGEDWLLPVFALFATVASLAFSRWIFQRSLASYRSASS